MRLGEPFDLHRVMRCAERSLIGKSWATPVRGMEFEAYIFEPDEHGGWRPIDTPGAYVYGTGPSVDPTDSWTPFGGLRRGGDPLESVNSEYDTPQFEFTLRYGDALRAATKGSSSRSWLEK